MTGKSFALAGLVAIAVLALWGAALSLAGDDAPFVPPSVELGGPPVTIAPAITAEAEPPDDPRAPSAERRAAPRPDADDSADAPDSTDGRGEAPQPRAGETTVVAPLPVRVAGDSATPIAPANDPRPMPSAEDAVDRASPKPDPAPTTSAPIADDVEGPASSGPSIDHDPAPMHIASAPTCQHPGAPGLAQAADRTAGTPASPPPRGNGPGCAARAGAPDEPRDRSRDEGRSRGELQAVREQDDEGHDSGRGRGDAGRGGRGAGGR